MSEIIKTSRWASRRRSPNFTAKEVELLVYNVELVPELVKQALRINRDGEVEISTSNELSVRQKLKIWDDIADKVNSSGESDYTGKLRTGYELKKKWTDLRFRVKSKAEDIRKGKLHHTTLTEIEERVLQLITKSNAYEGVNSDLPPPAHIHYFKLRNPIQSGDSCDIDDESNFCSETTNNIDNSTEAADSSIDSSSKLVNISPDSVRTEDHVEIKTPKKIISENVLNDNLPQIIQYHQLPVYTLTENVPDKIMKQKENLNSDTKNNKQNTTSKNEDLDTVDTLWESQRDLKKELSDIKRLLYRISQQKRKRLEQENEKIQLKKMKLFLKCKKQGIDYEEFIAEFL